MRYTQLTDDHVKDMLGAIGVRTIEDLFSTIPSKLRLKRELTIPKGVSEPQMLADAAALAAKNADCTKMTCFLGGGSYDHFIPGLVDDALIGRICEGVSLPVNVMVMEGVPSNARLAELGVARISYGPIPYIRAMKVLEQEARTALNEAAAHSEG